MINSMALSDRARPCGSGDEDYIRQVNIGITRAQTAARATVGKNANACTKIQSTVHL